MHLVVAESSHGGFVRLRVLVSPDNEKTPGFGCVPISDADVFNLPLGGIKSETDE
jgi:hypothetical protein